LVNVHVDDGSTLSRPWEVSSDVIVTILLRGNLRIGREKENLGGFRAILVTALPDDGFHLGAGGDISRGERDTLLAVIVRDAGAEFVPTGKNGKCDAGLGFSVFALGDHLEGVLVRCRQGRRD
jgi:hypothetical protein